MATIELPYNVNFTEMAIYFDEHINDPDGIRDDDLLFSYVYHWFYMYACKHKNWFKHYDDYDNYAFYCACKLYPRALKKTPEGKSTIRSLKNYVNAVASGFKVDFQKEEFNTILDENIIPNFSAEGLRNVLAQRVQSEYSKGMSLDVVEGIKSLPDIVKRLVNDTPYKLNPLITERLYISVMLTLISGFTLSNRSKQKFVKLEQKQELSNKSYTKSLVAERGNSLINWRLPKSFNYYIIYLCNLARKTLVEELWDIKSSYELNDDEMNAILLSAYNRTGEYQDED